MRLNALVKNKIQKIEKKQTDNIFCPTPNLLLMWYLCQKKHRPKKIGAVLRKMTSNFSP
jgi:hypothetical protein